MKNKIDKLPKVVPKITNFVDYSNLSYSPTIMPILFNDYIYLWAPG